MPFKFPHLPGHWIRIFQLTALALLATFIPLISSAQSVDLSADELSFDVGTQTHIARGDARFVHEQVIMEADEIRYEQKKGLIQATGNVRVTQVGIRLITDALQYNVQTKVFQSGPFRAGYPPVVIEGDSFSGTLEEIKFSKSRVYYGEPDQITPSVSFEAGTLRPEEEVTGSGVSLNVPFIGGIPLPDIARNLTLDTPPVEVHGSAGYSDNRGLFGSSHILYPTSENLAIGGNLDIYSKRGLLIGPAVRFSNESIDPDNFSRLDLSTGWIDDHGELGVDIRGENIEQSRYFGDIEFRTVDRNFEIHGRTSLLSDSEIMRDFRPDVYDHWPVPDSFFEISQVWKDTYFSIFSRVTPNNFHSATERMPEISISRPTSELWNLGLFQSWNASYVRYRHQAARYSNSLPSFPNGWSLDDYESSYLATGESNATPLQNDRINADYKLQYPIKITSWLNLVPVAEGRFTRWDQGNNQAVERAAGQLGFDLTMHSYGEWDLDNRVWGVDGLRHVIRPKVAMRWGAEDLDGTLTEPFDTIAYSPLMPLLNLSERRDIDSLNHFDTARFGVENLLITRSTEGATRTLLQFDLYQDYILEELPRREDRYQTYLSLRAFPAPWLELSLEQKWQTLDAELEETRFRTKVSSAEAWEVNFSIDYLQDLYDEYSLEASYQLNRKIRVFGGLRYDFHDNQFLRQIYGIRQRVSRDWIFDYAVVIREGTEREGSLSLHFRIQLAEF